MPEIAIPFFDNALIDVDRRPSSDGEPISDPEIDATLANFLSLTIIDRNAASRHLVAYYDDFRNAIDDESWLAEAMGMLSTPDETWRHVRPGELSFRKGEAGDTCCYAVMEAECTWEEEHGLWMVWRNGLTIVKVGGYDGHVSNADAYGDARLRDVVYHATDDRFRTFV